MSSAFARLRAWPVWDLFYPPLCAVCGRTLQPADLLYCGQCWADAHLADLRDLHRLNHVDMVRAGFSFGGPDVIREAVHGLKYEGRKRLAPVMVRRLLPRLPTRFLEADLVWVPVPLHWRRRLARGFNQSALLAVELARLTGHVPPQDLLCRVRHTPTQTARTYRERAANIRGAFRLRRPELELPPRVLLIDDVITTGATVDECAATLKQAGVQWVDALSFALAHHR